MRLIKFYLYFFKQYKTEHLVLLLVECIAALFIIPIPIGIEFLYRIENLKTPLFLLLLLIIWLLFSSLLFKKHIRVFLYEPIHIIAADFYKKFLNTQDRKIDKGFIIDSFNSNGMMSIEYLELIAYMFLSFFKFLVAVLICSIVNARLLIISIIPAIFLIPIQMYFYKHLEEKISNFSKHSKSLNQTISEINTGLDVIIKYEASAFFLNIFLKKNKDTKQSLIKKNYGNSNELVFINAVKTLYIPCLFIFSLTFPWFSIKSEYVLFSLAYIYFISSIMYEFIDFFSFIRETSVMTEELIKSFPEERQTATTVIKDIFPIEIKKASVALDKKIILNAINAVITKGEKIAIVGETGSGKTSFFNILTGDLHLTSGTILFSNKEPEVTDNYLPNIALSDQRPYFFKMSLSENIFFAVKDNIEVEKAIKAAHLQEFYNRQDFKGLTCLNPGTISQGEKSRLSFLRILEKDADLILLDETTAALDSQTEAKVLPFILEKTDKTVICITHRLSTLMKFKRVLFFDSGKIVYDGVVGKDLLKNAYFYELFKEQIVSM